jgi:hypothetical protein
MNINGVTNVNSIAAMLAAQATAQNSVQVSTQPIPGGGGTPAGGSSARAPVNQAGSTSVTQLADGATITTVRNTSQAIVSVTTAQQAATRSPSLQPAQTTVSTVDIIA